MSPEKKLLIPFCLPNKSLLTLPELQKHPPCQFPFPARLHKFPLRGRSLSIKKEEDENLSKETTAPRSGKFPRCALYKVFWRRVTQTLPFLSRSKSEKKKKKLGMKILHFIVFTLLQRAESRRHAKKRKHKEIEVRKISSRKGSISLKLSRFFYLFSS